MNVKPKTTKSAARASPVRGKKEKPEKIDGLSPKDIAKLRSACRQVWHRSYPRKLCEKRAYAHGDGFPRCERCGEKVPKIKIDHVREVGHLLSPGYFERLFIASCGLQALCKACHDAKTKEERRMNREFLKAFK